VPKLSGLNGRSRQGGRDTDKVVAPLQLVLPAPKDWVTRVQSYEPPEFVVTGDIPPVEWCIEGWIQRGLAGVLVAAGGTGKTTLMLLLAISHATGRPFLGLKVQQGQSLI